MTGFASTWGRGVVLALASVCAAGHAAAAEPGAAVGIVSEYQPVQARLRIVRAGRPLPLTIGTQVLAGDTVRLGPGEVVLVSGMDGQVARVQGPGEALPLAPPQARELGVFGRMLASMDRYFGETYRVRRMAASQGGQDCLAGAIEVPLFPDGGAVVAGTRDLRFAWVGGCAPFTVVVRDAAGRELARHSGEARNVRFNGLALAPGRLQVEVSGGGRSRMLPIDVVATRPRAPDEITRGDGGAMALLAEAWWLADQEQGRWRFEAFDLVAPRIKAGDPLAGKIGDMLLWGDGDAQ